MTINIDALITAAQARADSTATAAQNVASSALNNFFIPGGTQFNATVPALRGAPPAYTGSMNIVPDIKQAFEDAFGDFKPEMLEGLADYLARFFPESVRSTTDNWICNTILYGGTGIPADIEDAIWQRARAADAMDARRLESEALNTFAARGFSMPSGHLASQLMAVQQEAANKASTVRREIAIKAADIEIENIKFAVQQGVAVRASVLGALGTFLKAYMAPIEDALEKAKIIGDAQQRLWSSSADYYRAMVSEAELGLRAQEITARSHDTIINMENSLLERITESRTSAAVSVAQVLGNLAAGASSAAITMAGQEALTIAAS